MGTYSVRASEIRQDWSVADAAGQILGRLARDIATVLTGQRKQTYSPQRDGTQARRQDVFPPLALPGRSHADPVPRSPGRQAGGDHPSRREGDDSPKPTGPGHDEETQDLRRFQPPARGADAPSVSVVRGP